MINYRSYSLKRIHSPLVILNVFMFVLVTSHRLRVTFYAAAQTHEPAWAVCRHWLTSFCVMGSWNTSTQTVVLLICLKHLSHFVNFRKFMLIMAFPKGQTWHWQVLSSSPIVKNHSEIVSPKLEKASPKLHFFI